MMARGCCQRCKLFHGMQLGEYDKVIANCEAYPDGIPEAVFYAGHRYPKPGDHGLKFVPKEANDLPEYCSKQAEDDEYQKLNEYYEKLDMSDEEWLRSQFNVELNDSNSELVSFLLEMKPRRETEPKIW